MRACQLLPALHVKTFAFILFTTSCVFAQSPSSSTSSTTTHFTSPDVRSISSNLTSPSSSDSPDPNSIASSGGLSGSAIAGLCAVGGFVLVFVIAAVLFFWNRRADRTMRTELDVQDLVLSMAFSGDEEAAMVKHAGVLPGVVGPLGIMGSSMRAVDPDGTLRITPPPAVYRTKSMEDYGVGLQRELWDVSELGVLDRM
ncbi:Acid protease [Lasiodiplodia theobromae]|uniref:Acid protease n=1 Tax=Lasiodiplodia theobromae TaxID=45133 RepID=UPI0015C3ABC4|nr:Acid protease [Lasiodiplodia theobromae]KAF4540358.1 Acid protease [Lasiodiplodia theobromae]